MLFFIRTLRAAGRVSLTALLTVFATLLTGALFLAAPVADSQNAAPGPNSDPTYQALRSLTLSGEAVSVNNLELKRDAGTFHLHSGTLCFVSPVAGRVTGAVFVGDGNFVLEPPRSERAMLKLLTKEDEFSENFSRICLAI
jgi:hypothetical protein